MLDAQANAHDRDRPADEAGDVLGAEAAQRVDAPHRRVDRAQQRRERGLGVALERRRRALARLRVGAHRSRGEPAEVRRRAGEVEQRPGIGGAGAARRDLPDDAAADRLVHQLAERVAGDVEELERLVDVVREEEAAAPG